MRRGLLETLGTAGVRDVLPKNAPKGCGTCGGSQDSASCAAFRHRGHDKVLEQLAHWLGHERASSTVAQRAVLMAHLKMWTVRGRRERGIWVRPQRLVGSAGQLRLALVSTTQRRLVDAGLIRTVLGSGAARLVRC